MLDRIQGEYTRLSSMTNRRGRKECVAKALSENPSNFFCIVGASKKTSNKEKTVQQQEKAESGTEDLIKAISSRKELLMVSVGPAALPPRKNVWN